MKLLLLMASFILVMLFVAFLAFLLERYWRAYQAQQTTAPAAGKPGIANRLIESVTQRVAQLRAMVQPAPPDEQTVTHFRQWIERDLGQDAELQRWLLALPASGMALLTQHIAAFCKEMNFDLTWLLAQQVTVAPELKQAMQAVIIDYCRACQHAVPAQGQARLFHLYQKLLQNPTGKEEQALGRTLYANLTTAGLVPVPAVADLTAGTEKERQQQVLTAIQQAAATDWVQFAGILQATITSTHPTTPAPNDGTPAAGAHNGSAPNGVTANGALPNGVTANGVTANGIAPKGKGTPLQSRQEQLRSKQVASQAG